MTSALAPYHVPHAVMQTIIGSVGGALEVAARAGGVLGAGLGHLARAAFASGMDLGLTVGGLRSRGRLPGGPAHAAVPGAPGRQVPG